MSALNTLAALRERMADSHFLSKSLAYGMYGFLIIPSLIIIPASFGNTRDIAFPPKEWSLDLYVAYFTSESWLSATVLSFQLAVLVTIFSITITVPAAYALSRTQFPGKNTLSGFIMAPVIIPTIVFALGLYFYLAEGGLSGTFLGLFLAHSAYVTPFIFVTVSAALNQIDERLEMAMTIMGASRVNILLRIVLPQITPALISAALFAFLISFDEVVLAWFIGGANTETLPVKMYSSIEWETSPILAVVSTILTVLSSIICLLASRFGRGAIVGTHT